MDWITNLSKPVKYAVGVGVASVLIYSVYNKCARDIPSKPIMMDEIKSEKNDTKLPKIVIEVDNDIDIVDQGNNPFLLEEHHFESEVSFQESEQSFNSCEQHSTTKEPVEVEVASDDMMDAQKPNRKVLLLGLEKSGKSSLLSQLSREGKNCVDYEPTKGFNVVCISFGNVDLSLWEIGGSKDYRSYWKNFCHGTDQIFFVVDSTDHEKFEEAREFFQKVYTDLDEEINIIIIGTKSDAPNSASLEELQKTFSLEQTDWPIFKVAVQAGGAHENMDVEKVQQCCLA